MQKIYLKPLVSEISIRGNPKEGHTDVFAYNYHDDDNGRKLGGLYIVGNVKQNNATAKSDLAGNTDVENTPNIAYVINLVASLAKREYYSRTNISPRDAFLATLKKINGVIEDFFKDKSLKINIGIFAIAGEQIYISKLGKFKIILGRDSRTVDILNNIDLFNKELVEEKEFSNVVSGKVMAGDKLFAFYPNPMVTAREKTLKMDLLRAAPAQFIEKVNSIKETKTSFDCGALYLSLDRHKEPAVIKNLGTVNREEPGTDPAKSRVFSGVQDRIYVNPGNLPTDDKISANLAAKDKANSPADNNPETPEPVPEVPKIISSEFSLGRKKNFLLSSMLTSINMVKGLYDKNIGLKKKFMVLSLVAGMLLIGVLLIKTFVVINPEQRQLNTIVDQTQNNLKLARTKISQNDFIGARKLLLNSLSSIYAIGITNNRTQKTTSEIYGVLDNMDKAVDASPTLLEAMPEELNKIITILNANKDRGIALSVYENNLYALTNDNILKITDIDNNTQNPGEESAQSRVSTEPLVWLKSGNLPPQPIMMAVDGNIYVMNDSGTLAVFYKGEKVSDTNTFIVSSVGDVLLTSKDSSKLYLVNKTLTRIYELDKETGTLIRTLKVGSSEPFVDAYLTGDSTIIVVTPDNRIWEVK